MTEIRAPKGYILDKTPRTITIGETSNDTAPSTVQRDQLNLEVLLLY
nr:SpaA isopeptide-forming pilin-related protein [Streptococcus equi]